jgi:hypothetical protein
MKGFIHGLIATFIALITTITAVGAIPGGVSAQSTPSTSSGGWTIASEKKIEVDGEPVTRSPDGRWLAGIGPDKNFCVWKISSLKASCSKTIEGIEPPSIRWSPDSSAVAFTLYAARYLIDSDIYVFDVTTGKLSDITDDGVEGTLSLADPDPAKGAVDIDVYPAWSPDSQSLVFARTNWNANNRATTLASVGRDGGKVTTLQLISPTEPLVMISPMFWLKDDSIVFSVWHADIANGQNGVWKRQKSGTLKELVKGTVADEIPMPVVTSVTADGHYATITSYIRQSQFSSSPDTPIYFLVDLRAGKATPLATGSSSRETFVNIPGRLSASGDMLIYGVRDAKGNQSLAVLTPGLGAVPTLIPFDQSIAPPAAINGVEIANDDTVYVSTRAANTADAVGTGGSNSGVILTLTSSG